MDQQLLQARAVELEQLLARLAPGEAEAADLYSALRPLLAQAMAGTLSMRWHGAISLARGYLRKAACAACPSWNRPMRVFASKRPAASRRPCASCAAIWNHADPLHLNIICCFQVIES